MSRDYIIQSSVAVADVHSSGIIHFLIALVVLVIICGLLSFAVDRSPLGAPWKSVINWILIVIPVVYIVFFLLQFVP